MNRVVAGALAISFLTACGDLTYPDLVRPPAGPPGSTLALGAVSAVVDGEQFTAPLQTPATYRNDNFGFSAAFIVGSVTRTLALSVRLPGPGTYTVGGANSPTVSFLQQEGATLYRWTTASRQGAGSVTLTFFSADAASGDFSIELVPDSATAAAGYARRYLTGGVFNVTVSR